MTQHDDYRLADKLEPVANQFAYTHDRIGRQRTEKLSVASMAIFMFHGTQKMNARRYALVVPHFPLPLPTPPGEDYLAEPARAMRDASFEVEILTLRGSDQALRDELDSIAIRRFHSAAALLRHVRGGRFDLIHAHSDFRPSILAGVFGGAPKTILTRHSYVLPKVALKKRLLACLMNQFDRVVALTSYERDVYIGAGVLPSKIVVVPHPVNVAFFAGGGDPHRFRARWKLDAKSPAILFVANLRRVKNIETVFRATARLLETEPSARLIVVGRDLLPTDGEPDAREQARRIGLEANVVFTDWLDAESLRDAFCAASVFVNSSFDESFLLAAHEAAAASVPLCLPRIGSLKCLFGANALYHEPTDDTSLAANILRYLREPVLRASHTEINRNKMVQANSESMINRLTDVYFSLLNN